MRLGLPLAVLIGMLLTGFAKAAEPFYLELLQQGKTAQRQADYPQAARILRIACFGFLEEPPLLAEGLVHMALAQAASGDREGFLESYHRIEDLEHRFGAYRRASLDPPTRFQFETEVVARIESPALIAANATAQEENAVDSETVPRLSPKQERSQLKRALRGNPQDARALHQLARLELREGRPRKAGPLLDRLLLLEPDNSEARCLRGRARLQIDQCPEAVEDLDFCPYDESAAGAAIEHLQCLVEAENWQRAALLVGRLPAELAGEQALEVLITQIAASGEPVARPGSMSAQARPEEGAEQKAGPPDTPSPQELRELEDIRSRATSLSRPEDLVDLLQRTLALNEQHPSWRGARHLAAELGYRASRWSETVRLLGDGSEIPDDRPDLLFYLAVALFEEGQPERSAQILQRALPRLERTPFVDRYVERILLAPSSP